MILLHFTLLLNKYKLCKRPRNSLFCTASSNDRYTWMYIWAKISDESSTQNTRPIGWCVSLVLGKSLGTVPSSMPYLEWNALYFILHFIICCVQLIISQQYRLFRDKPLRGSIVCMWLLFCCCCFAAIDKSSRIYVYETDTNVHGLICTIPFTMSVRLSFCWTIKYLN